MMTQCADIEIQFNGDMSCYIEHPQFVCSLIPGVFDDDGNPTILTTVDQLPKEIEEKIRDYCSLVYLATVGLQEYLKDVPDA